MRWNKVGDVTGIVAITVLLCLAVAAGGTVVLLLGFVVEKVMMT